MAKRITAVGAYRPRIEQAPRIDTAELAELLAMRTGMHESELRYVLTELRDVVAHALAQGHSVRIEGLGVFAPSLRVDGSFTVTVRVDRFQVRKLNHPGGFRGTVRNREHIGKSPAALVAQWNTAHPDDPAPVDPQT
jgi:ribosomal protein S16